MTCFWLHLFFFRTCHLAKRPAVQVLAVEAGSHFITRSCSYLAKTSAPHVTIKCLAWRSRCDDDILNIKPCIAFTLG